MSEVVEPDGDSVAALSHCGAQIDVQTRDRSSFHRICGATGKAFQPLVGGGHCSREKLAFGPEQLQLEDQLVAALPAVFRQQRQAGNQTCQR